MVYNSAIGTAERRFLKHIMKKNKAYNGPGIYALVNNYCLAVYIGSTRHIEDRRKQHFADLKKGKHPNKKVQEFYEKGRFDFVIIEELPEDVDKNKLHQLERMYIYKFCTCGYFVVCNREAGDPGKLKNLIFHTEMYINHIESNMNNVYKKRYGTGMWNVSRMKPEKRGKMERQEVLNE